MSSQDAIKALIMDRFDLAAGGGPKSPPPTAKPPTAKLPTAKPPTAKPSTNGTTTNGKRSNPSDAVDPPSKKHKPNKSQPSVEDLDHEFAVRLQAEEMGRARSTRGGGTKRKAAPKKEKPVKKKKKKSKAKVGSDDEQ